MTLSCPLCHTAHPGHMVCRASVASWLLEEAGKPNPRTRSVEFWEGYNAALLEVAEFLADDDRSVPMPVRTEGGTAS